MKKVLITGSEGFIGSHLVEEMIANGYEVKALVLYNSNNNWGWLETFSKDILENIEVVTGDVRDYGCMKRIIKGVDMVYHLGALIAIPYSYTAPESYVDTNIKGTLNVLEACKEHDVKRVILTSTSEVYGSALYVPIDEKHPLQGQSPYSATKIGADKLGEAYYRSYDMPITIVRPFNTYGPRQSARAVIPTIITQLLSGSDNIYLGDLTPTRDFNYVKDTVKGFRLIGNHNETIGEVINIATQKEISIGELAKELTRLINPNAIITTDVHRMRPEKSEVNRLLGSNEKLYDLTGWRPEYSLSKGLEETIEWIKKNLNKYKANKYNL